MTLDDLVNIALVGTGRVAPKIADAGEHDGEDSELSAALASARAGGGAEDQLLGAAAVLTAYEVCGASLAPTPLDEAKRAPADERAACSRRAAALLVRLLALTNTPTKQHLLLSWLAAASRLRLRAPHALLPQLLDYGAATRAAREAIAAVIDQRGLWLMSLNPKWQFAAAEDVNVSDVWATGNREQRTSALRRLRESDPAAGRELVQATWKEDAADERAGFVEAMSAGLSLADEPMLEATLDDRSKQVRAAAADLLSQLPGSALVERMRTRAEPLVTFVPQGPARLLRKAKPASIEFALPGGEFDPTWARDGMTEKSSEVPGPKQWWLVQMLRAIPPSHWSAEWQLAPAECVAALTGDFAELAASAWATAAERYRDVTWMDALLRASIRGGRGQPRVGMLNHLPAAAQRAILAELLESPKLDAAELAQIADAVDFEFDPAAVRAALGHVERQVAAGGAAYNYHLPALLERLAPRLPTNTYDDLTKRWTGPAWDANRKALDAFFQTLQLRRDIQAEFAS